MCFRKKPDIAALLKSFPRARPPLPPEYQNIYEKEYTLNREGGKPIEGFAKKLEAWMHRQVTADGEVPVLEVGAGTLNHLKFEKTGIAYDIVEPFTNLYKDSPERGKVRAIYSTLQDIPQDNRYMRIISVAVLEHMEDLPREIEICARLLSENGTIRMAIPSEGGLMWYLAWRFVTGCSFWLRNKLDYAVLMRHEHLNKAVEIETVLRYYFKDVKIRRWPLPWLDFSFYTVIEAKKPV